MDTTIAAAFIAGVSSIVAAVFAYRASGQANRYTSEAAAEVNRIASTKVDGEAYERSQQFYEKLLVAAEKEVSRLQQQVDRLREELDRVNFSMAAEVTVSDTLRSQVRELQQQVSVLSRSHGVVDLQRRQPRHTAHNAPRTVQREGADLDRRNPKPESEESSGPALAD